MSAHARPCTTVRPSASRRHATHANILACRCRRAATTVPVISPRLSTQTSHRACAKSRPSASTQAPYRVRQPKHLTARMCEIKTASVNPSTSPRPSTQAPYRAHVRNQDRVRQPKHLTAPVNPSILPRACAKSRPRPSTQAPYRARQPKHLTASVNPSTSPRKCAKYCRLFWVKFMRI